MPAVTLIPTENLRNHKIRSFAVALILLGQCMKGVEPGDFNKNIYSGIELMARGITDDNVTVIVGTVAPDDLRRTPEHKGGGNGVAGIDIRTALMSLGLTRVYVQETLHAKQPVPKIVYVQRASSNEPREQLWAPSLIESEKPKLFLLTRPDKVALPGTRLGFQRTRRIIAENSGNPLELFKLLGVDTYITQASWFELYLAQGSFELDEPPMVFPPLSEASTGRVKSEAVQERLNELQANIPKLSNGFVADVKMLTAGVSRSGKSGVSPSGASPSAVSDAALKTKEGKLLNAQLNGSQKEKQ